MSKSSAFRAFIALAVAIICLGGPSPLQAAVNFYGVGARYHTTHSRFEEYPFRSGDISWLGGIEFHEGIGYWQLLLGYTPSVKNDPDSEQPEIDSILTPQLNLIIQDQGWLAGTGILSSYIKDEVESDWGDIYWQTIIGYQFRMQYFTLDITGAYAFDRWSNISDFRFNNLEFVAMLKRRF